MTGTGRASSTLFRLLGAEARRQGISPSAFAAGVLVEILKIQSRTRRAAGALALPQGQTEVLVQDAADLLWPEQMVVSSARRTRARAA